MVGTVTGNGKVILSEGNPDLDGCENGLEDTPGKHPVDLDLELVLGKMPQKVPTPKKSLTIQSFLISLFQVFKLKTINEELQKLALPIGLTVEDALNRVLRLPSVASKRYLTNKVDRCVTGLIAQQQCVGPLHTPLADVAVTAVSYFNTVIFLKLIFLLKFMLLIFRKGLLQLSESSQSRGLFVQQLVHD